MPASRARLSTCRCPTLSRVRPASRPRVPSYGIETMAEPSVRPPRPHPEAKSLDTLSRLCAARLESVGVDWRPIAARHGLRLDGDAVEGTYVPTAREQAFLAEAALASRDLRFDWDLGELHMPQFGLLGYAVLNAPTVRDALRIHDLAIPTACEAVTYTLLEEADEAVLVRTSSAVPANSVFGLRRILALLRDLIGPHFTPKRVGIEIGDRAYQPLIARLTGVPTSADLPYAFVGFPARHLRAPVAGADERLAATLQPYWEREVAARSNAPAILRSRLESAILQRLHEGTPSIDRLADQLQLGRARLAADLESVGGYRAAVDAVRRRIAEDLVRRTDLTMARIAASLGFSEPGALHHAYRRWTGHCPAQDRRQPLTVQQAEEATAPSPRRPLR